MPRPFKFNLQQVLDYRSQLEDQAKQALSKALMAQTSQQRVVDGLAHALAGHEASLTRSKSLTAADMWLWRAYKDRLDADLAQARTTLASLERDVTQRRLELIERAKQRKLLEKLKQTKATRHAHEESRKEQAEFDEMATLRYRPGVV